MIWIVGFTLLQIAAGLLYGNMAEWVVHKYLLHELGRKKTSWFSFHWHQHHRNSRQNHFFDKDYEESFWKWNARGKETLGLTILLLCHVPLLFFVPWFFGTLVYCAANYYYTHKWAHENPIWAKEKLRWHWEHHMASNQDANYGVTQPWCDYIMGTRVHYREELAVSGKPRLVAVKTSMLG